MWFCGMSLFYIWSLTMHGRETHLAVVSNTFLCLHVSNGKGDTWGRTTLGCVHWNFLMGLSTGFLRMTCKSCVLQWFRSLFTAKPDPSITVLHLKKTGHSLCPCLTLWIWITAPVLGLLWISLVGGTESSSANSLWEPWWRLFQRFTGAHSARSPGMAVLLGSRNQTACRCVACVCQQHESVLNSCDSSLWKMSMRFLCCFMSHTLCSTNNTCCT